MTRQVWEWLVLVFYVECVALLIFSNLFKAKLMRIETTNLVSASPGPEWLAIMINMSVLCVGLGLTVWWFKSYGVLIGLSIFLLGLVVPESL